MVNYLDSWQIYRIYTKKRNIVIMYALLSKRCYAIFRTKNYCLYIFTRLRNAYSANLSNKYWK